MSYAKYRVYALDHFDMESTWLRVADAQDEEEAREAAIQVLAEFVRDTLDAGHEETAEDVFENWLWHGESVCVEALDRSPCKPLDDGECVLALAQAMIAMREPETL